MQNTPNYGWPFPEPGDHTRTWEYCQALATASDATVKSIDGRVTDVENPPFVHVEQTVAQSIASGGSGVPLNFDAEISDTSGMHSPTTNPTRVTCARAGIYLLAGSIAYAANASNRRGGAFAVNGAVIGSYVAIDATATGVISVPMTTEIVRLVVGDYVELFAWHDVGAALNTYINPAYRPRLKAMWICK